MWEESQAENTRLRMEMSQVKSDLESTKYQLQQTSRAVSQLLILPQYLSTTVGHFSLLLFYFFFFQAWSTHERILVNFISLEMLYLYYNSFQRLEYWQ